MPLIVCGSIHQGHERFSDDFRGRQEIFVFGCSIKRAIFADSRMEVPTYRSSPASWRFFFSLHSVAVSKNASIRSKLPTAAF